MSTRINLNGNRYSRLTVIQFSHSRGTRTFWECVCECGTTCVKDGWHLKKGATKSCGCLLREAIAKRSTKHEMHDLPEYGAWKGMMQRCYAERTLNYKNYGGRGIRVCVEWHDVKAFVRDMGARPSPSHSIDRINNDGNYEPSNCRWATRSEQCKNRRPYNHGYAEPGKFKGVSPSGVKFRLDFRGKYVAVFASADAAAKEYDRLAVAAYGKLAKLNF